MKQNNKKAIGRKSKPAVPSNSPILKPSRKILPFTQLLLCVRAGGRCQFDGCNKFLLEHSVTLTAGNFAQMAHIVAFSEDGPRGNEGDRPLDINNVDNLMLLCPSCHKLIDDHPEQYTVPTLVAYKQSNESRIHHVTGLGPDLKTTVVQLKARIAGQSVAIPISQVTQAVAPRYPTDAKGYVIDLNNIDSESPDSVNTAVREIARKVASLYEPGMDIQETRHISLFALGPIPLLVFLGRQLSNKVPVDVYQRHRDTEDWVWKESGEAAEYGWSKVRSGSDRTQVALVLSLSGKIDLQSLPSSIDDRFTIYELTLASGTPSPTFLRTRNDLNRFKDIYQIVLRTISRDHGQIEAIHLFPAVPAPVAVLCGRELLPKVDPSLFVYDYNKSTGGFTQILKIA